MPRKEDIAKYLADKQRYAGEKVPSMTRRRLGHDYEARRMYLITITVEGDVPSLGIWQATHRCPMVQRELHISCSRHWVVLSKRRG